MPGVAASEHRDVIVVGAGPTGLALVRLLTMSGVTVALVDPRRVVCHHPRATHVDDETMRVMQTLGVAGPEPDLLRMDSWELFDSEGERFVSFVMAEVDSDQGWFTDYQFHQPDFESRVRGLIATSGSAALYLGWTATTVEQTPERATVCITHGKTGATRTLTSDYVVGADGASSALRSQVSTDVEDLHGTQRSLIVDVYPFEHPAELPPTKGFVYCDRDQPVTYVPIGKPRLRFEFMLGSGGDVDEFERPTTVYRLLGRWMDPSTYRIERADVYEWHARLAHGWRNGRLLIAGDAAHEMPPMLGQGMCSGLRDATNLAWKLTRVVQGRSGAELLDTYESERSGHVRPYIEESARQANMIEAFGYAENRPPLVQHHVMPRFRPPLGPGLTDLEHGAGHLAAQPRTAGGELIDDVVGFRFAVLADPGVIADLDDEVRTVWKDLGAILVADPSDALTAWLQENGADAAIIRPDRYVHSFTRGAAGLAVASTALRTRLAAVEVSV